MADKFWHSYDPSTDYIRYPTLTPQPRPVVRCSGCGSSAFEFLLPHWQPLCKRCGLELELPAALAKPPVHLKSRKPRTGIQICGYTKEMLLLPDNTVRSTEDSDAGLDSIRDWTDVIAIDCAHRHAVGLRKDGTILTAGNPDCCGNASTWSDITAIAAGSYHTVGLRSDGTVAADGCNYAGECDVREWSDIIAIDAAHERTVGLRKNGTVLATKTNRDGEGNIHDWRGITAIAAGIAHTVGLRKNGTICAVGLHDARCDVQDWSEITAIDAGNWHTVGLCADGTVKAVGLNSYGQCNTDSWTNIVKIWATDYFTAAMTADGTILCTNPAKERWFRECLD